MTIIWSPSPNFTAAANSVANYGVGRSYRHIVIHWWGEPANKPTLTGTVNWLRNPSTQVSAHYVVSGDTVHQLVQEENIAWHARQANPYTIGIEVDPNVPGNTYKTVAQLVKEISLRRGIAINSDTIAPHKRFVITACPGTLDLARIIREANGTNTGGGVVNNDIKKAVQFDRIVLFLNQRGLLPTSKSEDYIDSDKLVTAVQGLKSDRDNNAARATKWDQIALKLGFTGDSAQVTVDQLMSKVSVGNYADIKNAIKKELDKIPG